MRCSYTNGLSGHQTIASYFHWAADTKSQQRQFRNFAKEEQQA